MDRPQELTHISLCAGYGGIDLGLQRALGAVRTIAFSEIESYACANLVAKMEAGLLDSAPIWTDLKTFPWSEFRGKVDILSGGFPCQPFSAAGARRGDEDPRHLFPHILRGLRELGGPALVFLENVEGIISSKLTGDAWADPQGTPVLLHVLRELERVGYSVTAGVFSASEVGATHQRKRVFILGVRADLGDAGHSIVNAHMAYAEYKRQLQPEHTARYRAELSEDGGDRLETMGHATRCASRLAEGQGRPEQGRVCEQTREPSTDGPQPKVSRGRYILPNNTSARWPAGQGAILEHSQHDGSLESTLPRSVSASCYRDTQGTDGSVQSTGASSPLQHGNIQSFEAWPAGRGAQQHAWEPPRVTPRASQGHPEPTVGGDADGPTCGLDYAQLCVSRDSLVDELRLLGNGVVPATAERAFRVLWAQLHAP